MILNYSHFFKIFKVEFSNFFLKKENSLQEMKYNEESNEKESLLPSNEGSLNIQGELRYVRKTFLKN